MISDLKELNNIVNNVVNRIVKVSTTNTSTGNWYADYDDVADLISHDDYLKYFDFIYNELLSRSEVLDLNITDEHEFDGMYGLAYCPNYVWCEGDERTFHMTEEEWEHNYVFEPVDQPLSMTRKSQILDNALVNIQSRLGHDPDDRIVEVAELFGISVEELAQLDFPSAKQAIEELKSHNINHPIEFIVSVDNQKQIFDNFEDAFEVYDSAKEFNEKKMYFRTFDSNKRWPVGEQDRLLYSIGVENKTIVNSFCRSRNPYAELAYAKAILSIEPTNEKAWKRYNAAEEKIGVTAYMMGNDLKVGNWRIQIVPPQGRYGRSNQLVNESGKYLVQFYDLRYIDPVYSPKGQFTGGEYDAATLLGKDGWGDGNYPRGLSLDSSVPEWTVSAKQMAIVLGYIRNQISDREKTTLEYMISSAVKRAAESQPENNGRKTNIERD